MLLTVGYQRRELAELVALLTDHGVEVLVDVRETPRSRKPGFSGRRLAEALTDAGIEYRHEPSLGVPQEERDAFRTGEPAAHHAYLRRVEEAGDLVAELVATARRRHVALLCLERDEADCHRGLLASRMRELDPSVGGHAIE